VLIQLYNAVLRFEDEEEDEDETRKRILDPRTRVTPRWFVPAKGSVLVDSVLVRARISCEIFPGVIKFPSLKNTCMFLPGEFGTVWFVC